MARRLRNGDSHMMTRRVMRRENRMKPTRKLTQIIGYLLAVLTEEYNIELNATCYLGDHEHNVAYDPESQITNLARDLHARIAQHVNVVFGDEGPLWDSRETHLTLLVEPDDIVRKMAYVMANPVKHQLVKHAKSYPGLRMAYPCKPKTFKRPTGFLDADAKKPDGTPRWPPEATLRLYRPRGFEHLSDNELAIKIANAMRTEEESRRAAVLARNGKFVGRRKLRDIPRDYQARTHEERGPIPRVACEDGELRAQVLAELGEWHARYQVAMDAWRGGDRSVEFPYGTFKMRVLHKVRVAPAPT